MKKNGFTLIELLVTLAILGIILAISVPNYMAVQSSAGNQACTQQRALINKVLNEQMAQQQNADPETLLQTILDDESKAFFNDQLVDPTGGTYSTIKLDSGKIGVICSIHGAPEGAITFTGYQYNFSDGTVKNLNDIGIDAGNRFKYNEETGKFVANYGTAFIPYEQSDHYKLTTTAELSEGSNGYGLFLETSLDANGDDTGTIIQFDPGVGTMIALREREGGNEGSASTINISDFIEEADFVKDENGDYLNVGNKKVRSDWWSEEHTMSLEVEIIDDNTKGVNVYIDDIAIIKEDNNFSYIINTNQEKETYTGFRAWNGNVAFSNLDYENLE